MITASSHRIRPSTRIRIHSGFTLPCWVPGVFSSLGATELSGEASKASCEAARKKISLVSRRPAPLALSPLANEKTSGIQGRRGRHSFPTFLSYFCRPFCPVLAYVKPPSGITYFSIQLKTRGAQKLVAFVPRPCLNLRGKYWRQFCDDLVSENIRIRPSTRIRIVIGFKKFHSGERIQKFPDLLANSPLCVWTIAVSGKKKLRIKKYPDTC